MGRQIGQGPTIVQGLIAIAISAEMCKGVEEWVQGTDAPNVYPALAGLPKPLVDTAKAFETERKTVLSSPMEESLRSQADSRMKLAQDRTIFLQKRLESRLAALQCVEAIRAYMTSHGGRLPAELADITEVSVPKDPIVDGPFRYTRTVFGAVLESSSTADAAESNRVSFEISARR